MLLSATAAGKHPKDQFDFFPLTIDVEERMYAAGRIPGSFFRREGRPSTDAILTCRLIDRPLRPTFVKGLRNEVQVVITVLALNPDDLYDVVAINAASMSTQLSGLPFSGPIGGVRVALIEGQWVAFPRHSELERAVFDMVVAGRVVTGADGTEDVAIMMVEAEATDAAWNLIKGENVQRRRPRRSWRRASRRPSRSSPRCAARSSRSRPPAAKPTAEFPLFLDYQDDVYAAVEQAVSGDLAQALTIAGKTEREARIDELKESRQGLGSPSGSRAARRRSRRPTGRCRRSWSASASCATRSASTAAAWPTSASSRPRSRSSRGCTARRCSSAARRRSWASPR